MNKRIAFISAALAFGLGACSSVPAANGKQEVVAPVVEMTTRERVQGVVQLLDQGEEERALSEIDAVLAESPNNPTAINLLKQVQSDPQKMLGASYKTYTVLPGDTLSSLAKTYLGDAMLFYALSRYNELPAPNRLMVGQSLKLPDKFPGAPKSAVSPPAVSRVATPVATTAPADVEAAKSLRLQGLEQLNKGDADQAVALLEKAARLDTDNQSISADLARAQRIQKTLRKPN